VVVGSVRKGMRGQWSQGTFFIGTSLHPEDTVGLLTSPLEG